MEPVFDTYGLTIDNLNLARQMLEAKLGLHFKLHDSSYLGGDYFRLDSNTAGSFVLQRNFTGPDDDDWQEPDFKQFPIIFFVNNISDFQDIEDKLKQENHIKFLKRERA